ncbi:MAG: phospholipase [Leifsonia sp.]
MQITPPDSTRPTLFTRLAGLRPTPTLRRSRRAKLLVATSIVAVGLMAGTGAVALSATASAEAKAAATASALQQQQKQYDSKLVRAQTVFQADETLVHANAVLASAANKVDATPLASSVASLANYETLDNPTVVSLAKQTLSEAEKTQAATTEADRVAAEKAAAAAAEAAAQAAAKAAAVAAASTPNGARAVARDLAASQYGWDESQFSCLNQLWQKESGWSYTAYNADGGATGIPQALPGSKMAAAGSDWETNAATQISWGLSYIKGSYGTPCAAWGHSQSMNWY